MNFSSPLRGSIVFSVILSGEKPIMGKLLYERNPQSSKKSSYDSSFIVHASVWKTTELPQNKFWPLKKIFAASKEMGFKSEWWETGLDIITVAAKVAWFFINMFRLEIKNSPMILDRPQLELKTHHSVTHYEWC